MADQTPVQTQDLMPVFSRISWGALLAGLFITLAVFVLLSTLGTAIGISSADQFSGQSVAIGAGIWAIATMLIAFFCGGCVVSRCTAGETRGESVMYGTVLWGAAFALIMMVTGSVLKTGSTLIIGSANTAANASRDVDVPNDWEAAAQRAEISQADIDRMRAELPSKTQVQGRSAEVAWWTFAGVVLSMSAAIAGAVASSGPQPMIGGVLFRRSDLPPGRV